MKFGIYDTVHKAWMGSKHGVWLTDAEDYASVTMTYFQAISGWPLGRAEVRECKADVVMSMAENPGFVETPFEAMEWFEEKR